jgi:hypothetical protein
MARISEAASLLGKRSWKARLKRFGLKRLQEMAAEMGRKYGGRPRLPDDQVSKAALYQRERRERLKQQAAKAAKKDSGARNL